MGLADAIKAAVQKPGTKCTVGELILTLNAEDRQALNDAFASKVSYQAILRGLREEGHEITRSPLERHRRQECACEPR